MASTARILTLVLALSVAVLSSVDADELQGAKLSNRALRPRSRVRRNKPMNTLPKASAPSSSPGGSFAPSISARPSFAPSVSARPSSLSASPPDIPMEEDSDKTPMLKIQRSGKGGGQMMRKNARNNTRNKVGGNDGGGNGRMKRNALPKIERDNSSGGKARMKMMGMKRRGGNPTTNGSPPGEREAPAPESDPNRDIVGSRPLTSSPTVSSSPSSSPSYAPSPVPTRAPTEEPTQFPTEGNTEDPTYHPTTMFHTEDPTSMFDGTWAPTVTFYPTSEFFDDDQ